MQVYGYDGSFEGFLCALDQSLCDGHEAVDFRSGREGRAQELFRAFTQEVVSDRNRANVFRHAFIEASFKGAFATLYCAFLSEAPSVENLLWRYARKAMRYGSGLADRIAEPDVNQVGKLARYVAHEAHKYEGFVRFQEVREGFLYAAIEPGANILGLLARHFAERIPDTPWFLHDLKRSQAALFDTVRWELAKNVSQIAAPELTEHEALCKRLWQGYFTHLAIEERRNTKLQRQHVPLRMRKHMSEFEQR